MLLSACVSLSFAAVALCSWITQVRSRCISATVSGSGFGSGLGLGWDAFWTRVLCLDDLILLVGVVVLIFELLVVLVVAEI